MIILTDLTEPMEGRVTRSPKAQISVGRESSCDISYSKESAPTVSREHARVVFDGQWYRIDDLGSRHGTWVNGQRLRGRVYLKDGDIIQFGGGTGPQLRVGFKFDREALKKRRKKSSGSPMLWLGLIGAMALMMVLVVVVLMMAAE